MWYFGNSMNKMNSWLKSSRLVVIYDIWRLILKNTVAFNSIFSILKIILKFNYKKMETLILNRNNIFDILPEILLKLKQGYEIKISFKTKKENLTVKPEVEKSWYRDPNNPKRFDYDIDREFKSAEEAIKFLRRQKD